MLRAGLIGAGLGLIYVMSLTLLSPFCTLCFTPLLGIGVGYLAGKIDKPTKIETSLSRGSLAGGITAIGVVVGQITATLVNGILLTNLENLPTFLHELGLPQSLIFEADEYWQSTLIAGSFCSALNLMIIVGLGATGSLIWFQRHHQRPVSVASL